MSECINMFIIKKRKNKKINVYILASKNSSSRHCSLIVIIHGPVVYFRTLIPMIVPLIVNIFGFEVAFNTPMGYAYGCLHFSGDVHTLNDSFDCLFFAISRIIYSI